MIIRLLEPDRTSVNCPLRLIFCRLALIALYWLDFLKANCGLFDSECAVWECRFSTGVTVMTSCCLFVVAARRCGPSRPGTLPSPTTASPAPSTEWERCVSPLFHLIPSLRAWDMSLFRAGTDSTRMQGFLCCVTTVLGFVMWFGDGQWWRDWELPPLLAAYCWIAAVFCSWIESF